MFEDLTDINQTYHIIWYGHPYLKGNQALYDIIRRIKRHWHTLTPTAQSHVLSSYDVTILPSGEIIVNVL